jgi:hypothetical protein
MLSKRSALRWRGWPIGRHRLTIGRARVPADLDAISGLPGRRLHRGCQVNLTAPRVLARGCRSLDLLTRKMEISLACGRGPWPSGPVRVCGAVWVRRLGPGLLCRGRVRDAAEGDFEAGGAELADVVGDLPADAALALVVVRAEVLMPHAGVGQQLVVDHQLGVPGGDAGLGRAASSGQPPVAVAFAGLGAAAATAVSR